jgi:hypothetical protein
VAADGRGAVTGHTLVLVPSRERWANAERLVRAVHATSGPGVHVALGVDDDDPQLGEYEARVVPLFRPGDRLVTGPRGCLSAWTNRLWEDHGAGYAFLASLGDDHEPVTDGWAEVLAGVIETEFGGHGMAYPDDRRRADIPEAVVMSASVAGALGWVMLPDCRHFYVDNAWAELGAAAGMIRYCPDVVVPHRHYTTTPGVERDGSYAQAEEWGTGDHMSFLRWRAGPGFAADVAKLAALR